MVLSSVPLLLLLGACSQESELGKLNSAIAVSPALIDFGDVAVGASRAESVTLTHVSGGDVTVTEVQILDVSGTGFTADDLAGAVVSDGNPVTLPVEYAPSAEGWDQAQVTIYTDEEADNAHVVDLRGHAAFDGLVITPSLLDFGPVPSGDDKTLSVQLANLGDLDLTIESAVTDAAVFTTNLLTAASLPPGADIDVDVTFAPDDDDPAYGTLTFALGGTAEIDVTLRGNACEGGDPGTYDADADGWTSCGGDCDDGDPAVHDGGVETCDGADDDCDGVIDDGTSCFDDDGDGYTEEDGDCADDTTAVHPGAVEDISNGVDDDCDGAVDLGTDDPDGDGYSESGGDCREGDASFHPGAPESCDGLDQDCDGAVDEDTLCTDDDGDGQSESAGDCDDDDATVYSGAPEVGNGVDDDCDGLLDEDTTWGDDDDGWSERGGDCDDGDDDINPGAREQTGDGVDNDCDGVTK